LRGKCHIFCGQGLKVARVAGAAVGVIPEMSNPCGTREVDIFSERFARASESIVALGCLGGLEYLPKLGGFSGDVDVAL